jgi:putative ABC transport system permease protein
VFLVPLLLVAGAAGLATRIARLGLRSRPGSPRRLGAAGFFAVRRLAAARGLLVAIAVVSAVSLGAFLYAESLNATLDRSVTEKAYLGYGGDAQGVVDPTATIPKSFPYPATKIDYGNGVASLGSPDGPSADVLAIDPASFGRVVRWYPDWGPDPRRSLSELASAKHGPLPMIVAGGAPATMTAIWIKGVRLPARIVARVHVFPAISAGTPMVVVGSDALRQAAARAHLVAPIEQPQSFAWATGPPAAAARALAADPLHATYVTTVDSFTADPDVKLAERMFRYMRVIAVAAAILVLAGLLLYLQARQRTQTVGLALAERMGLRGRTFVLSLVLELSAITLVAAAVGGAVALAAGAPIVKHIDPLPDSPPAPTLAVPYGSIAASAVGLLAFVCVAALLARWSSRRADVAEALRVD